VIFAQVFENKALVDEALVDNSGWELAKHMHLIVLDKLKDTARVACFIAISCDEVTLCDSGQWLSLHTYVVSDWIRIPVLLHYPRSRIKGLMH
jgi:hypothetical protein